MYQKSTENSNIVNNNPEAVNLGLAELILKQWALDTIFSPEVKRAHDTGAVHLSADATVSLVERIRQQAKFHSMIE